MSKPKPYKVVKNNRPGTGLETFDVVPTNLRKKAEITHSQSTHPSQAETQLRLLQAMNTLDALSKEVEQLRIMGDRLATQVAKRHPEQVQDWWNARNGL